jgi:hypothetical protein
VRSLRLDAFFPANSTSGPITLQEVIQRLLAADHLAAGTPRAARIYDTATASTTAWRSGRRYKP